MPSSGMASISSRSWICLRASRGRGRLSSRSAQASVRTRCYSRRLSGPQGHLILYESRPVVQQVLRTNLAANGATTLPSCAADWGELQTRDPTRWRSTPVARTDSG